MIGWTSQIAALLLAALLATPWSRVSAQHADVSVCTDPFSGQAADTMSDDGKSALSEIAQKVDAINSLKKLQTASTFLTTLRNINTGAGAFGLSNLSVSVVLSQLVPIAQVGDKLRGALATVGWHAIQDIAEQTYVQSGRSMSRGEQRIFRCLDSIATQALTPPTK